jgi:hypothetical protein
MVREREGRFLFKFKRIEGFYDVGNKQAVRKTVLLLGHYQHGEEEDCAQEGEAAPEVLEKLKDLSKSHLASREVVAEVMKLLIIPPRIDPIAWEHRFLQKRRARLPFRAASRDLEAERMKQSVHQSSVQLVCSEGEREAPMLPLKRGGSHFLDGTLVHPRLQTGGHLKPNRPSLPALKRKRSSTLTWSP